MKEDKDEPVSKQSIEHDILLAQENEAALLFGREKETCTLVEAFKRSLRTPLLSNELDSEAHQSPQELVFISGSSGTGKTALANWSKSLSEKW